MLAKTGVLAGAVGSGRITVAGNPGSWTFSNGASVQVLVSVDGVESVLIEPGTTLNIDGLLLKATLH